MVLFSTLAAAEKERYNGVAVNVNIGYLVAWGIVALLNMCFNSWWDMTHDWGLFKPNSQHRFLRSRLVYSPKLYYFAIVSNTLCRMSWTLSLSIGISVLLPIFPICSSSRITLYFLLPIFPCSSSYHYILPYIIL